MSYELDLQLIPETVSGSFSNHIEMELKEPRNPHVTFTDDSLFRVLDYLVRRYNKPLNFTVTIYD